MTGHWTKMRGSLTRSLKVRRMAEEIIRRDERCATRYFGENIDVTTVALAVTGGLLNVWSTVAETARNGRLDFGTTEYIDTIAGLPGLGDAMLAVGWLERTQNGLKLHEYDEYNTDAKAPAKSAADRMREYRARQKAEQEAEGCVTKRDEPLRNGVTAEKNRIEQNRTEKETPLTPQGECLPTRRGRPRKQRAEVKPALLDLVWAEYPRKVGKPDGLRAIAEAIAKIAADPSRGAMLSSDPEADAATWLAERTAAYAASDEVKTRPSDKIPYPGTWFRAERYAEDPNEWRVKAPEAATEAEAASGGRDIGAIARKLAEQQEAAQ